MPKEHPIVKNIKARIEVKEAELKEVDARIDDAEKVMAALEAQRAALVLGIDEDTELLEAAKPKQPRVKKAKAAPEAEGA